MTNGLGRRLSLAIRETNNGTVEIGRAHCSRISTIFAMLALHPVFLARCFAPVHPLFAVFSLPAYSLFVDLFFVVSASLCKLFSSVTSVLVWVITS